MTEYPAEYFNCTCAVCGKKFHDKPSHIKKCKNHYCSKKCHYEAKKQYMSGEGNHQYGLKGDKNSTWKSDRRLSRYGYIQVRDLDHPFRTKDDFILEHRLVAENYLLNDENSVEINGKRYLRKEYDVHHINFNRTDNRVENLMVLTKREHKQLHNHLNSRERNIETGQFEKVNCVIKPKRTSETAIIPQLLSDEEPVFGMFSDNDKEIKIKPNEVFLINTNEAFTIPKDKVGAVYFTHSVIKEDLFSPKTCVKALTFEDTGSISLLIENSRDKDIVIKPHEMIAVVVFSDVVIPEVNIVV